MAPLCICHHRRPISRTVRFHGPDFHSLWYVSCRGLPNVPFLNPTESSKQTLRGVGHADGTNLVGPRFALIALWYLLNARPKKVLPKFVAAIGVLRSLACAGFTYVTSTDDHDRHDVFMISYIVATVPWTFGCIALSPPNPRAIKYRKRIATAFFTAIVPMVYLYIQHKIHRVAGG